MVIGELREKYSLETLLTIARIPKSTYFYQLNIKANKDEDLIQEIKEIFNLNHQKYGYIRITIELRNRGYKINKKKVYRLMKENNLTATPKKIKYRSYIGEVGKIAKNILSRDFDTTAPYQKLGTDITQFIAKYGKLYLSPIIDFHTREILAYDLSEHPNFDQIKRMLNSLIKEHGKYLKSSILHSDQGWQYQMKYYQKFLTKHKIAQSMSRKENCLDNSPTENFFGRMKTEFYYDKESTFNSLEEIKTAIHNYIYYYNHTRIVIKTKSSPVSYRQRLLTTDIINAGTKPTVQ